MNSLTQAYLLGILTAIFLYGIYYIFNELGKSHKKRIIKDEHNDTLLKKTLLAEKPVHKYLQADMQVRLASIQHNPTCTVNSFYITHNKRSVFLSVCYPHDTTLCRIPTAPTVFENDPILTENNEEDWRKQFSSIEKYLIINYLENVSNRLPIEDPHLETHIIEPMPLGAFVIDKADINITDPAIIVFVHSYVPELRTIRRIKDGHLSNRDIHELSRITPLQFCIAWSSDKISYTNYKETR